MKNLYWVIFIAFFFYMEQIWSQEFIGKVDDYLYAQVEKDNLKSGDTEYLITNEHISNTSGVHHIYFSQSIFGLEIFGTNSSIHIGSGNEIISEGNSFLKDLSSHRIANQNPGLSAKQAILSAADQLGYKMTEDLLVLNKKEGKSNEYLFSDGGISVTPIPVRLIYYPTENDDLVLAWELSIQDLNKDEWWNVRLNSATGKILDKENLILSCSMGHNHSEMGPKMKNTNTVNEVAIGSFSEKNESGCSECYEVLPYPVESPLYGERTLEIMTANLNASPLGWHDTNGIIGPDHTTTRGNNVNAIEGGDHFGYQPDGGPTLNFTGYSFNQIFTEENQYEDAAVTNLFYWINTLHDLMYGYGFNEEAGNFQEFNYTGEGNGGDSVMAQAQNIDRECNGTFGAPSDGGSPIMKIDLCNDKDGVFDSSVLIHEFSHGISIRLVGGSFFVNCLTNVEQMGEGWSDWYALMTTMKEGDTEEMPRGIANYYRGDGALGGGVREFPYTTDLMINPLTYDSVKTVGRPHGVGTVWAAMLWEMTWGLINEYGYDSDLNNFSGILNVDAGNVMALAIVTEALKLTTCRPGFVDARDAVLTANRTLYGTASECIIWAAFAKRGLGHQAHQGDSNDLQDGLESFIGAQRTATLQILNNRICEESTLLTAQLGGLPFGGIYSGPGVTDNGDGASFTFDPSQVGIGIYNISYNVFDDGCLITSIAEDTLEVFRDNEAPSITCPDNFYIEVPYGQNSYLLPDLIPRAVDNCSTSLVSRQEPPPGSIVGLGYTDITFYATDASGNEGSCTSSLIVEGLGFEGENTISIYPNPTDQGINIDSKKEILTLMEVIIVDINSRLVMSFNFEEFGFSKFVSLDQFQDGLYFVKIETENYSQIYKMVKK